MNKRNRVETVFLYAVFICYILFLFKLLLLSRVSLFNLFSTQRIVKRSINLVPFYSIRQYIFSNSEAVKRFAFSNVAGNIIIFIPLGTYLLLFKRNKRVMANLLVIFTVSLCIEIIQGILGIGAADIDDIILNCSGGLIGILGYKLILRLVRNEEKVRDIIAVLSTLGLPFLLYLLFIVRLRL